MRAVPVGFLVLLVAFFGASSLAKISVSTVALESKRNRVESSSTKVSRPVVTLRAKRELAAPLPNLNGNWKKSCENQDGDFVSTQLQILANQWVFTQWGYEDEDCQVKYLKFERSYQVVWGDIELDLKLVDAAYTPMSDEVARALNEVMFCGVSDWKKNKKVSILGKNCSDVDNYVKNQMTFSIYQLETVDGTRRLKLGQASPQYSGETVARRHIQLEPTSFDRQK